MTNSLTSVTDYLFTLLEDHSQDLGLAGVFYGDQVKIPRTPTACVEPVRKTVTPEGAPRRVSYQFEVDVILYLARVQDMEINYRELLLLAESTETLIHEDVTFGGLVYGSYVQQLERAYVPRQNTMLRAARLSVVTRSKYNLPMAPGYNQ